MPDEIKEFYIGTLREMHPVKTFECGQCFRWNADERGVYLGVAGGRAAEVYSRGDKSYIRCSESDFNALWRDYFDLDEDYAAISSGFSGGEYLDRCAAFGEGIRILRQESWEALCSFIISQCNNIPRIKGIVEKLCSLFGEPVEFSGRTLYSFPGAETLAQLSADDLAPLRCGYRAPYIISAAKAVASGGLDLDALTAVDTDSARAALLTLNGVGAKVANCAVLFGLHHTDAFPIDVWMKRALKENFPPDFDPKALGSHAGLAQQYIFYYARSGGSISNG